MPSDMKRRIRRKWRPPLSLVIGGTLSAVLILPVIAIGYFKVAGFILGWGETTLLIGTMAVVVTLLLAFLLWRLVLRPVYALTAHANAVKEGRDDAPLPAHFGTPELTALGQAVLDMGSTLQDREAGLRAYTSHVTHELRSPLTSLIGATELLEEDTPVEDRVKLTETIRASALKMQVLLDALRRLAAARDPMGRGPTLLSQALDQLDTTLVLDLKNDRDVPLDRDALHAILTHIVQNAAAHGASSLTLIGTIDGFIVQDNGSGITEGNRTRVFEPFFTTRRLQGGTGMGLAIVRTMLGAAAGEITLLPSREGARFEITFD